LEQLDWINGLKAAGAVAGLPMPVVAALNGDTTAHGLELALAADLRIAADSVVVAAGNIDQVGFPFDGATQRLPRLVGPALARDMLFTGRTLTATECLDAGLVNRVVAANELSAAARALASQIVAAAPIASRFAKEAVTAAGDMTLEQGLRLEADLSIILQSTSDREEGLLAFREKRVARFLGQ
jgi:enoyl-CoA hydratase